MPLKKTITITISIFFLLHSSTSFSQNLVPTSSSSPPVFTFLSAGDRAPFSGTLFSPEATAEILNEATTSDLRCKLRVDRESSLVLTKCRKELDLIENDFKSEIGRAQIRIAQKDKELDSLRKLASKNDYNWLWATGGVVAGVLVTMGVLYGIRGVATP